MGILTCGWVRLIWLVGFKCRCGWLVCIVLLFAGLLLIVCIWILFVFYGLLVGSAKVGWICCSVGFMLLDRDFESLIGLLFVNFGVGLVGLLFGFDFVGFYGCSLEFWGELFDFSVMFV